ncbi:MAG: nucleoside 2-deoxyribosyltransferase [Calditrichaeota bacterium]|nr:nucleoside 2-deoxyribosyltransferase [Calditrichota bacterium]
MRPNIEELIKTLKRQKGQYVPLAELGIHPKIKEKFIGRPIKDIKDEVEFWHKAGYDYIKLQPAVDFNPAKINVSEKDASEKEGTLAYDWANEGQGIIASFDDFERYVFPEPSDFDYSAFEKVKDYLPEGMGVIGQYGDIFTMTWEMMGMEGFSMALFENPDLIKALNDRLGELVVSMFEYFAQSDVVDALWYSDDIAFSTGLLMSPDVLHSYFFPWLKKIGDLARAYDKPLIYHTDGVLWDVFEDIIACGVDALHPIEPKAMDLAEVKRRYGDRLCLIGAVDVDMLCRGSKEQVEAQVKHNIEVAAYNGGYCVGSGNSIPDYVNFENYLALLEAAKKYGEK